MPTIEPRVIPDDHYSFSLKDLDKFIIAIERRIASKEIMHPKEAAAYLGISLATLYRLKSIPYHKLEDLEGRLYLRSEIIEKIRSRPTGPKIH